MSVPLEIQNVPYMTATEEEQFFKLFTEQLAQDDGSAAQADLAAGYPIYYSEEDTPDKYLIKEYPDGRKEYVTFKGKQEVFIQRLN